MDAEMKINPRIPLAIVALAVFAPILIETIKLCLMFAMSN